MALSVPIHLPPIQWADCEDPIDREPLFGRVELITIKESESTPDPLRISVKTGIIWAGCWHGIGVIRKRSHNRAVQQPLFNYSAANLWTQQSRVSSLYKEEELPPRKVLLLPDGMKAYDVIVQADQDYCGSWVLFLAELSGCCSYLPISSL